MAKSELNVVTMDHDGLKQSLIDFLKTTQFGDFNYEGSAINTMVDLLTRNSTYTGFLANMVANESFIDSAQVRANVSSHAQKLSYIPRTQTAARLVCDLSVTPSVFDPTNISIIMEPGTVFLAAYSGKSYSFTNIGTYVLNYDSEVGAYVANDVTLYQGQYTKSSFIHSTGSVHTIPNLTCDSSTLSVISDGIAYSEPSNVSELTSESHIYFRGEDHQTKTTIQFGRDVLGQEPTDGSIIETRYIATEPEHANGVSTLIAAGSIEGFSNIVATVTTNAYGGEDRDTIEDIRFIAPRMFQIQDRALNKNDFIPLLKTRFPFIDSGITWGGEDNDPPIYGSVFISILTNTRSNITTSVKSEMVDFLKDKAVGSITPTIVDPDYVGINLDIKFSYDSRVTKRTFNELQTDITTVVNSYSDYIQSFDKFYNESQLIANIKDIEGVESVYVDKIVKRDFTVLTYNNPIYTFNMYNEIEKGSLSISDFVVDYVAEEQNITDDSDGNIILTVVKSGETTTTNIGTIDYTTGVIEFTANFINGSRELELFVTPVEDNYYTSQNQILYINSSKSDILTVKGRV